MKTDINKAAGRLGGRAELMTAEMIEKQSEAAANLFNIKCLIAMVVFVMFSEICNDIGIFTVDKEIMHIAVFSAMAFFAVPVALWLVHDRIMHRLPSVTENSRFKFFIVFCSYLGITVTCVVLTFHAVILMPLPAIFAAQYADQKTLLKWTIAGSVILIPLSVYGGFFFGLPDRNLFAGFMTEGAIPFRERLALCPPERYLQLFYHYVIPRFLGITIIDVLLSRIAKRNSEQLERQTQLAAKVNYEMNKRNALQSHVIEDLSSLIETRDESTGEHVMRTKNYVGMLARAMAEDDKFRAQLPDETIEEIESAAPLHDVGKIAISDTILLKPGRLTPEEFEVIKTHTTRGGKMIRNIFSNLEDPSFLRMAEDIAVSHHEWWDGSGYPQGLKGEEIPLAARIMAVADVYDALVSDRVYKRAMPHEKALAIIYEEAGTHFDPDIIRILRKIEEESETA